MAYDNNTGGRQAHIAINPSERQDGPYDVAVKKLVYENADSGYLVANAEPLDGGEPFSFVGSMLAISPGETVRLWGSWEVNPKYGRQLKVHRWEILRPTSIKGIERYLSSGMVHGIGKQFAQRIVKAFGTDTLRVIDEEPEKLTGVEGIGPVRAERIRKAWEGQRAIQAIMVFLQGHGIGAGQACRIYKRYGDRAVAVLRENPYRLADEVTGIAFKSADAIARELGVAPDSPMRLQAGLRYSLEQAATEGHVFLPWSELQSGASTLLGVAPDLLEKALTGALENNRLTRDGEGIYLPYLYRSESEIARLLQRLVQVPAKSVSIKAEAAVTWVQQSLGFELSEEQRQALLTAIGSKVMVITGGPGTGKTTILKGLLRIFERKGMRMLLAAPTGRAAKRMEAASEFPAKTIHRLLEFSPRAGGFTRNEDNPLDADVVVIDECSMVDTQLMHQLLQAIPATARLFLVGDVDQLPSVGPGNVLMDIISSQAIPAVWLRKVFRQAAQSGIVSNAHLINQGRQPEFNTTDFFFVERPDPKLALDTIVDLVTNRIPKKFGFDPRTDVQVLAPMRRGLAGTGAINEALQSALNPQVQRIGRFPFGLNDKIMQLRNNYDLDVYNGDVGILSLVDDELQEVQAKMDERSVIFPYDALDDLGLAYATTVHKSQGSEYPVVVMPLLMQHYLMLQRNVFYTGITRARNLVVLVGESRALHKAVRDTRVTRRNTLLSERLRAKMERPG